MSLKPFSYTGNFCDEVCEITDSGGPWWHHGFEIFSVWVKCIRLIYDCPLCTLYHSIDRRILNNSVRASMDDRFDSALVLHTYLKEYCVINRYRGVYLSHTLDTKLISNTLFPSFRFCNIFSLCENKYGRGVVGVCVCVCVVYVHVCNIPHLLTTG